MTMKKQYERICPVCGKKFTADYHTFRMCSPECKKLRLKQWGKEYRSTDEYKKKRRELARAYRDAKPCMICGKPVYHTYENGNWHTRMHEKCIYIDIINTINTSGKISRKQYQRLISRGYNLSEFKNEFRDYLLDSPILNENEQEQG